MRPTKEYQLKAISATQEGTKSEGEGKSDSKISAQAGS